MDRNGRVKLERKRIQKIFSLDAGFRSERGVPVLFPFGPLTGAVPLELDSSGELESSRGQRCCGLFEEGGLHIPNVGGVVRPIGDVEGVHGEREGEGLV
jgi:hypothetical protein